MRFGDDDGIEVEALESPLASDGQLIETGGPGRFRTAAVVLGGLAMLGGVIAFAGRDSNSTNDSSNDTRPTATTRDRSATSTTIDEGRPTTTTVPPTTTTLPSVIGPLLDVPSGLRIVVVDNTDRLLRIDLDTGTVEVLSGNRREGSPQIAASGQWITWQGDRGLHVVGADGVEIVVEASGNTGDPIESDGTRFWKQTYDPSGNTQISLVEIDHPGGSELGQPVELPQNSYVAGVVAGHPMVWVNGGGTYALGLDGAPPVRLGFGIPAAVGGGAVLIDECDDLMRCAPVMVDVATGKRSDIAAPIGGINSFFGNQGASISPDRRYFAGVNGFDGSVMTVNDLQSGNEVLSKSFRYPDQSAPRMRWSKDGKWLVWQSGREVFVWSAAEPHADAIALSLPVDVGSFDLIDHA